MAHAEHFLSRLERMAAPEVELALKLYRDTEIVKEVIARVTPPKEFDRLALGLADAPGGPHLVVTRDGQFVTCLGPGMGLRDLFVVKRHVLAAVMERRNRERYADALVGEEGGGSSLFSRLLEPSTLSREEMIGASAYQPAMQVELLLLTIENWKTVETLRAVIESGGERDARERSPDFWKLTQTHGYLATMVGLTGRELFERLDERVYPITEVLAIGAFKTSSLPSVARGLWAAARLGKRRLQLVKQWLPIYRSPRELAGALFEIAALGLAHQKLFGEARKFLDREPPVKDPEFRQRVEKLMRLLRRVMDDPEAALRELAGLGSALMTAAGLRPTTPGDLDAWTVATLVPRNVFGPNSTLGNCLVALPFIAKCEAEQLYLPRASLEALGWRTMPLPVIEAHAEYIRGAAEPKLPVVKPTKKAGRNEPCPCGSGKKYKHCCGA